MIIYHHLGLGDHIICNGLVREFVKKYHKIKLICKYKNIKNIEFMYRDIDIKIIGVENDDEANNICKNDNCKKIGFAVGGQFYADKLWDETFYLNASIPFEYSWSRFFYLRDVKEENDTFDSLVKKNDYIFIHNIDSYGVDRINYSLIDNNMHQIITDKNIPFFNYGKIIENAKEVHCIDSSFKHLIDRIKTNGKLYYHKLNNRKMFDIYHSSKQWITV